MVLRRTTPSFYHLQNCSGQFEKMKSSIFRTQRVASILSLLIQLSSGQWNSFGKYKKIKDRWCSIQYLTCNEEHVIIWTVTHMHNMHERCWFAWNIVSSSSTTVASYRSFSTRMKWISLQPTEGTVKPRPHRPRPVHGDGHKVTSLANWREEGPQLAYLIGTTTPK